MTSKPAYENIDVANNMLHQAERDRDHWKAQAEFLASVLRARFDYMGDFRAQTEEELRPMSQRLKDALATARMIRP